jgi:Berberine and berberine like
VTIDSSVEALIATVGAWNASVSSVENIPGIVWALAMDLLPPVMYTRHAEANALGLTGRKGKSFIIINLRVTWNNADDDARVSGEIKQLIATMEREVGSLGSLDPFVYLNYAAPWQKPISSYGQASVERLARIREQYDPQRVFTYTVPGGFKILN